MSYRDHAITFKSAEAVMSTVLYFDIFKHPLTLSEICRFLHFNKLSYNSISDIVSFLLNHNLLFEKDGYYLASPHFENITRRKKGELLAGKLWPEAMKKSRLISKFPFVKSVIISGSLSKGYMDDKSDIDYLIITKPGRLWIARTFLAIYKKLFLLNSHKFFCVNYFLDVENLTLSDRNIYIATELLFSVPAYNVSLYTQFINANKWAFDFYPAFTFEINQIQKDVLNYGRKSNRLEKIFNGLFGDFIEKFFMKSTIRFWKGKFRNMPPQQFHRDMKNTSGISKHHPNGFRDRILKAHHDKTSFAKQQLFNIFSKQPLIEQVIFNS